MQLVFNSIQKRGKPRLKRRLKRKWKVGNKRKWSQQLQKSKKYRKHHLNPKRRRGKRPRLCPSMNRKVNIQRKWPEVLREHWARSKYSEIKNSERPRSDFNWEKKTCILNIPERRCNKWELKFIYGQTKMCSHT